jgi:hypothetical protein
MFWCEMFLRSSLELKKKNYCIALDKEDIAEIPRTELKLKFKGNRHMG